MGLIKDSLLENLPHKIVSSRTKGFSGFGLVVCALLSVIALILLTNISSKSYHFRPVFDGLKGFSPVSSSPFSPPSSDLPRSSDSNHSSNAASELNKPGEDNDGAEKGSIVGGTHEASAPQSDEISVNDGPGRVRNSGQADKNAEFLGSNGTVSWSTQLGNLGLELKNVSLTMKPDSLTEEVNNAAAAASQEDRPRANETEGGMKRRGVVGSDSDSDSDTDTGCDYFDGRWVRDDTRPYYPPGSCPFVDKSFNCQVNGRPDRGYLKWRWQPHGCDLPSLDAHDFLERLRGKKLVFVGDSLNRNMWESLVCILRHSIRNKTSVYEISGRSDFKKKGFYAIRFEDYNCSVDLVVSPFLVRESLFRRNGTTMETLRLDTMDQTRTYADANVIVFNTGHWWTHEKTSKGEDYYREGDYVYPRLKVLKAYRKALTTWARWVDEHIDPQRTLVFFRGYSLTHFRGGQWNSGGQCHKETEPIFNESFLGSYPWKMKTLEQVLNRMKTPVMFLNITRLTDYRKDGHPSIYRTTSYKTAEQRKAAEQTQDCSHWCLPGVPDAWNDLLYASLFKYQNRS